MPRKWMFLAAAMVSMSVITVGVAGADDEDSPLHKLMERVNAKNLAITKGVRTAVAFKKSQTDVVAARLRSSASWPRRRRSWVRTRSRRPRTCPTRQPSGTS